MVLSEKVELAIADVDREEVSAGQGLVFDSEFDLFGDCLIFGPMAA